MIDQNNVITFEGLLTDVEKKALFDLRGTEPFRLLRKLLGQEYMKISAVLTSVPTADLPNAIGQLAGIKGIYNLLLTLGADKKEEQKLPKHLEILQNSRKRGSKIGRGGQSTSGKDTL